MSAVDSYNRCSACVIEVLAKLYMFAAFGFYDDKVALSALSAHDAALWLAVVLIRTSCRDLPRGAFLE